MNTLRLRSSKRYALLIFVCSLLQLTTYSQYTTCAAAQSGSAIANGACLTNQTTSSSATAGNCTGGFNSGYSLYYKFVAGTCPEFDLTFTTSTEIQFILYSSACAALAAECSQTVANVPISEFFSSGTNIGPALTIGQTYILRIVSRSITNYSICYTANQAEEPSNECSGAIGLSPTGATFYNGGNCSFTGSNNDATTSDPPASTFCAGSLENTQWVKFQPTAGSTSFQIIGNNIACGGPVCAWQFGIFSGVCGSLTPEGCVSNGNPCTNGPDGSASSTNPTGGNGTYLLSWNSISATAFTGTITRPGGAPFTGTEVFYLVMDGNANSDCQYTLTGVNIQPLPIDIISFYAKKYNKVNWIEWEVASQLNNDYYNVERSTDGQIWEIIKSIPGDGTNQVHKKYAIQDDRFPNAINYYRIKQTDYDGKFTYSNIISVDNTQTTLVVRSLDLMGKDIDNYYKGLVIDIYEDGSSIKRIQ